MSDLDMTHFTIEDCETHIYAGEQNIKSWKKTIEVYNICIDELENQIIEIKEKLNELEDLETTSMKEKAGIGGIDE